MKYLPDKKLFFIHIPKCAGISVRRALTATGTDSFSPMAQDLKLSESDAQLATEGGSGFSLPNIGKFDPAHVPLAILEAHMPATFDALLVSHSFALTREPRARFLSALMQRLKEFKDAGAIRADGRVVAQEAAEVCEWLEGRSVFSDLEYIHFTRQVDFVDLAGKRIVKGVFPVDRTDALCDWIAQKSGLEMTISRDHVRRQPKRWARAIQPAARFAARNLMPRALKRAVYPLWTGSAAFSNASTGYDAVELGEDVELFIAKYYADDATLHAQAKQATQQQCPPIEKASSS